MGRHLIICITILIIWELLFIGCSTENFREGKLITAGVDRLWQTMDVKDRERGENYVLEELNVKYRVLLL